MEREKRVMIADDDAGIVDAVSLILEFEGYSVISSMDGAIIPHIQQDFPDLLLLDIWMSGTDGRDVCKQLKEKEDTRNIPIIMISASKDIENSAMEAGADDFLAKPFEMDELLGKIQKHLKNLQ